MSSFSASNMIKRMENVDHDLRYMAIADLKRELESDVFRAHDRDARILVPATVKLLADSSRDVRALAVEVFPLLVAKYKSAAINPLVPALTSNLVDGKEELRDVSALGLSVLLDSLTPTSPAAGPVTTLAIGPLVTALSSPTSDIVIRALEVLSGLLGSFGSFVSDSHPDLLSALLGLTSSPRETVRKHTIACIGSLTADLDADLFASLLTQLIDSLKSASSPVARKTLIATLSAVTLAVGSRMSDSLAPILAVANGLVIDPVGRDHDMVDVEVTEAVIQLHAAFVRRCPAAVSDSLDAVIANAVQFLSFDPNYADDEDDENEDEDDDYDDYEDYEDYDDDMSDDEDVSWKVRKAAAKCLTAVIASRPDMIPQFYQGLAPVLVRRFKERQDAVKADVFATFVTLVRATAAVPATLPLLVAVLPDTAAGLGPQLTKSPRARAAGVSLLVSLATALPGQLGPVLDTVVPRLVTLLTDDAAGNNALCVSVCSVLAMMMDSHAPDAWVPFRTDLAAATAPLLSNANFKIISAALDVLHALVPALVAGSPDVDSLAATYAAAAAALAEANSDRHVKVSALHTLGACVAHGAQHLGSDTVASAGPLLLASVENTLFDVLVAAVQAFGAIFASQAAAGAFDVSSIAAQLLTDLIDLLRKADRNIVLATLVTLGEFLSFAPAAFTLDATTSIGANVQTLLGSADLVVTSRALDLLDALVSGVDGAAAALAAPVGDVVHSLLGSAVLQGAALDSAAALMSTMVGASALDLDTLLGSLAALVSAPDADAAAPRQTFVSVAAVTASLLTSQNVVASHLDAIAAQAAPDASEPARVLALYTLSALGSSTDTSGSFDSLFSAATLAFDSDSERVKNAAAAALGSLAAGAPAAYVAPLLAAFDGAGPARQFLLLSALREFIARAAPGALAPHQDAIWALLLAHATAEEVGTRNVVAECTGALVVGAPDVLLPALVSAAQDPSPALRSVAVSALKFAVAADGNRADAFVAHFADHAAAFFALISDPDLETRRAAVNALNYLVPRVTDIIRDLVPDLVPGLVAELPTKKEHIRELKLGVITVKVDDGEQNRKGALETFGSLITHCLDKINVHDLIPLLIDGLKDKNLENVQLCMVLIVQLAECVPLAVVESFDSLADAFTTVLKRRPRTKNEKDLDAFNALITAALKAVIALDALANAHDASPKWRDFMAALKEGKWAAWYANGGSAPTEDGAGPSK